MVEQAEDFLRKTIRLLNERTERSFRREDRFEYPLKALREGIINALIHRNYFETADVRMMFFDNRIEIINPGVFPKGVTPEHPEHKPVNPTLCSLMYDIGFIEKYGSGIYMMKELCSKWGNEEPTYHFGSRETRLIFKSPVKEITTIDIEKVAEMADLNERQLKALEYIQEKGKITNREYRELTSISRNTATNDLQALVEKGILKQVGRGRGVYYESA